VQGGICSSFVVRLLLLFCCLLLFVFVIEEESMAEEEEEEEEEEQQLSSTSRSNGNSSSTLLPKEYVNLEDVTNRYLSEEIIPLQDVAGVQGAKQQNYSEKKLEQKCGTTKQMQQIAAAADNRQNASFDSNTQCHTATDMFNDMHGTSTELVENETNYTGDKPHDSGAFQGFSSLYIEREKRIVILRISLIESFLFQHC
jgi:hypothetical protein